MASVYAMALTRDIAFEDLENAATVIPNIMTNGAPVTMGELLNELRKLSWFDPNGAPVGAKGTALNAHEVRRREASWESKTAGLTLNVLFRGSTAGAKQGPYISQFMLIGTYNLAGAAPINGMIAYGLQATSQAQLVPEEGTEYMTTWDSWLEVQQGQNYQQPPHLVRRRIHTPRDLAGYVHFDALYQAYLNACLILLKNELDVDGGNPIAQKRVDNSMGFATWGGPHILSLVTEVATRGLRAARRTKFQVHRRARPEVIAARLAQVANNHVGHMDAGAVAQINNMLTELGYNAATNAPRPGSILDWVAQYNTAKNNGASVRPLHDNKNFLLPMAFIEGSPMHPAYGAAHATVAGACVTILKAFFESERQYSEAVKGGTTFYAADNADRLVPSARTDGAKAKIFEELDKLAANISIGRNMAGVHYYSDYYDSLRMGERIAISLLEEQMHSYHEPLSLSLKTFDKDVITLSTTGGTGPAVVKVKIVNAHGQAEHRDVWWTRDLQDYGIVDERR